MNENERPATGIIAPSLAPIAESQRLDVMDILRGIALIGILLMNIEWFNRSIEELGTFDKSLTSVDHAIGWLVRCFIEGKFYKLFALLFGMGFAVMLIRAREAGRPFTAFFVRRMGALFVIGVLHSIFLFTGDILHDYAFAGLLLLGWVLLFQRKRLARFDKPEVFLKIALLWLIVPFVILAVVGIVVGAGTSPAEFEEKWQEEQQIAARVEELMAEPVPIDSDKDGDVEVRDDTGTDGEAEEDPVETAVAERVDAKRDTEERKANELAAFTTGSYWDATAYRAKDGLRRLAFTPVFSVVLLVPVYLIGYWFVASGTLREHRRHRGIFRPLAIGGLTGGLLLTVGGLVITQHPAANLAAAVMTAGGAIVYFGQFVLAAGYLGTVVLMCESPRWSQRLMRFAPLGRMALTNYIMQSLILALIFHGYGAGMFGRISRGPQMLLVLAIVLFQVVLSAWWLKRYRFGPLEWVWRSLTYKSWQTLTKTPATTT